jgi:SAM-dependent methyltransferase
MMSIAEQAAKSMFVSPSTRRLLFLRDGALVTDDGLERYRVDGERVFFLDVRQTEDAGDMGRSYSAFNGLKQRVVRLLRATLFSSIRARDAQRAFEEFGRLTQGQFVLGVGGGPVRDFSSINLNIGAWPNVEVVADAHSLPYADGSVDHVSCLAVLEHLRRPDIAVQEMIRVLKPGGYILLETPGLQPYHGYPSHYQNFTTTGHDLLAERFGIEKLSSGAGIGPTSALITLITEYMRQYLPGGSLIGPLFKGSLGFLLMQLDRLVANRKNAFVLAGSCYFLGRKPPLAIPEQS